MCEMRIKRENKIKKRYMKICFLFSIFSLIQKSQSIKNVERDTCKNTVCANTQTTQLKYFLRRAFRKVLCKIVNILMLSRGASRRKASNEHIMYIKVNLASLFTACLAVQSLKITSANAKATGKAKGNTAASAAFG